MCSLNTYAGEFVKNDPILAQMPNVALAIHVLNEAYNPKSFWKPYLDALPRTYDTVMYFTPEEIGELKGSPAFGSTNMIICPSMLDYGLFC